MSASFQVDILILRCNPKNIEIEKTQLSQDMSSIQSTENNRQEHAAFNIETKIESKEDEDKDKADDEREKGFPAMGLPRNESAARLDTSINSHNRNRQEQRSSEDTKVDDTKESDSDGFDSQHAVECKLREESSHREYMLNLHTMTAERRKEDTKVFEFLPGRKPEVVDIGETNQLWHKAHDGSSDYWLQDVLDKRVNDYEDTKKV